MFRRILVPVDLHRESSWRRALPIAADQARLYGAAVILLYVEPGVWPTEAEPHEDDERIERLRALGAEHFDETTEVEVRVRHHNAVDRCIRDVASEEETDLIVMHAHDPGLHDFVTGSKAAGIVGHATCSVLVVR